MSDQDVRGKSLLDLLWEILDRYVEDVQTIADEDYLPEHLAEAKGRAHAMAVAISRATNPYHPDVDAIKAEAMERWENAHDVPPPPDPVREGRMARRLARRQRRAARNS